MTDRHTVSEGMRMPEVEPRPEDYNPSPHVIPEGENATPLGVVGGDCRPTEKVIIVMCGLPATGKTHIANRIVRYLSFFLDIDTRIFNVGDYRRKFFGAKCPAEFFDYSNEQYMKKREQACDAALADLMEFMKIDGVRVGVLDSTNSTRKRRAHIREVLKELKCKVIFLESICDQTELIEQNIKNIKVNTPDYKDVDPDKAFEDFQKRRNMYSNVYETLDKVDGPYMKVINSETFIVHSVRGFLPQKVVHFVMNLHLLPRVFYLSRHGQSEYNLLGKIGGDAGLTEAGLEYARRLAVFAKEVVAMDVKIDEKTGEEIRTPRPARLWTSTLKRTKETAQFIEREKTAFTWDNGEEVEWQQFEGRARRNLDELYAGICDGLTYKEIEERYPEEFKRRQEDKLTYRYPRGESYMDVTLRLETIVHDIERTREPILIVAHQGIHRLLYAYFMGLPRDQAPYVSIPLNTVIELRPHAYGCEQKRHVLLSKEEMLKDGQDEPITSMPMKELADSANNRVEKKKHAYSFDIMNPPSF
mmetsp:Transcript_21409/g.44532  ORF Transcript_21409/g.44532 Transcript_21409/m.44532 type:complete len:530 (+) Transcript_21409:125-1714(+)